MSDILNMIAKALPSEPAPTPDLTVPKFDWDAHVIIECTFNEFLTGAYDYPGFYLTYSSLVGTDVGTSHPRPCSIEWRSVYDRWIADEEAYLEYFGAEWDDYGNPLVPFWTMVEEPYLSVEGVEKHYTTPLKFVVAIPRHIIKARRGSGKTEAVTNSRAKSAARKKAKSDRDRAIRDRMKNATNKKK